MATISGNVDPVRKFAEAAGAALQYCAREIHAAKQTVASGQIPPAEEDEQMVQKLDTLSQQVDAIAWVSWDMAGKMGDMQREMNLLMQRVNRLEQREDAEMAETAKKVADFAMEGDSAEESQESEFESSWEVVGEELRPSPASPISPDRKEFEEY